MGYQSVGIQFVFQNLMHKLPGTTFIFFLGWKFSICQPLTLFHYFSHFSEIYWTLIYCYWYYSKRTFKFGAAFVNYILYNVLIKKNAQIQKLYLPNTPRTSFQNPTLFRQKITWLGGKRGSPGLFFWLNMTIFVTQECMQNSKHLRKSFWENV